MEDEDDEEVERAARWLEDLSNGVLNREFDFLTLQGLRVVRARKDSLLCTFVVPDRLSVNPKSGSDMDGNWHVGAMATLIDDVGAAMAYSATGKLKATLDFCVSYLSTAKIQEEVEIESKVVGPGSKGKLAMVVMEVRRKDSGKLIALAKQWLASVNLTGDQLKSKL
ncbi:uncharacterized protein LOC104449893 isoform X1 [Eucalyptus grandis]|uniref:uncharacterized protein LOC104449893 isoform X1 n=1 Tax=Eucalyptus grandis TaxID=71139 RepID=UPI00192ED534|nr:uncharacterized protein LOC104449893 isoform X1 [Eucalyptus grandis]